MKNKNTHLMKIFATAFTITTKVDVWEKAPEQMPICFSSVLGGELQQTKINTVILEYIKGRAAYR